MNTLLIGPRACGKTTFGRLLATRYRLRFVDLDDVVLDGFDESTVRDVWAAHGEAAWRAGEVEALRAVLGRRDQVVALGGGTPTIPEARRLIEAGQAQGTVRVAYLKCPVEELRRRLEQAPGDRPPLTDVAVHDEVAEVLARREPLYEEIADAVVDMDHPDRDVVFNRLLASLSKED
ncbi:MAG: shikimate kinase [Planctomycetota bacterium]|jgi:shikimate kinase